MKKQNVPIFMFHSISRQASPRFKSCVVRPETFDEHLSFLAQHRYTSMTVSRFARALAGDERLPERCVILTFDDGFADFYTHALPALRLYGFTATLYVATAFVGGTSRWLQHIGEGNRSMLTWKQLREISEQGIECAAHSHTHPQLDMLSSSRVRDEVVCSKNLLEDHLGLQVSSFAYPFGYYTPRVRHIVREAGFASACAIGRALSSPGDDPYALARLMVWPDTGAQALDAALSRGSGPLIASPFKRVRADARRHVRSMYGRLRGDWIAL